VRCLLLSFPTRRSSDLGRASSTAATSTRASPTSTSCSARSTTRSARNWRPRWRPPWPQLSRGPARGRGTHCGPAPAPGSPPCWGSARPIRGGAELNRSEEHTSELQSREKLVCQLLLEKKNDRALQYENQIKTADRVRPQIMVV